MNDEIEYKPKDGVNLLEIKYNNDSVWKIGKVQKFPDLVRYETSKKNLSVFFDGLYIAYGQDSNEKFSFIEKHTDAPLPGKHPFGRLEPKDHPEEVKIVTQDPSDDNKTKDNDTSQYKVYKRPDTFDYIFENNAKCLEFKCGDKLVWKHFSETHKEYPRLAYFVPENNRVIVLLRDNSLYAFSFDDNQWKSFFAGKPEPKQFGVNYKKSDECLEFEKNDSLKSRRYTAKGQYVFGSLKDLETVIYEAKVRIEYSNKVVVYEPDSNTKQVAVYVLGGHIKKFEKRNDLWFEVAEFTTSMPEFEPEIIEEDEEDETEEGEVGEGEDEGEEDADKPTEYVKTLDDEPIEEEEESSDDTHTNIEYTSVRKFDVKYFYYIIPALLVIFLLIALIVYK